MSTLAYRTARDHVNSYADEGDLMARSQMAMQCRDCEDFLQLGIDAFHWLQRADEYFQEAVCDSRVEYDHEVTEAIEFLYRRWLKPCEFAEKWITQQVVRKFEVDNLAEFRHCVEEVRAIVRNSDKVEGRIAVLRDEAVNSYRRGDTVDWEQVEE